jgi:hypothetical protein
MMIFKYAKEVEITQHQICAVCLDYLHCFGLDPETNAL